LGKRKTDKLQVLDIYSGISYVMHLKLPVLPKGLQVFQGKHWLPTSYYIPKWAYNKTHLMYALWPVLYISNGTTWTVVSGMHVTYCKHNSLVLSSVFNYNLSLLLHGCMCVETLRHIPRYMGRMSNNNNNNNNKMLINNSLCCIAIRVI